MKANMKCFSVNLPQDLQRKVSIIREFEGIKMPVDIIDAVDGRKMMKEELQVSYDEKRAIAEFRGLSRSELGCSLSHLSIYKKIIDESIDHAFITEDDARFNEATAEILNSLCDQVSPNEPIVVLLSHVKYYSKSRREKLYKNYYLGRPVSRHIWLTHGYFITQAAAARMRDALFPVWLPADHWTKFQKKKIIDVYAVTPYCVGNVEDALVSNLEGERRQAMNNSTGRGNFFEKNVIEQIKKITWPLLRVTKQKRTW